MPKEYKKICIVCGGDYIAHNHNSKICSDECKRKRSAVMLDARMKRLREKAEAEKQKAVKKKTLTELAIEAKASGMSYGKYVEHLEAMEQLSREGGQNKRA